MSGKNRGRKSKYPWDQWADGRLWRLRRGEDFTCEVRSFRLRAYEEAAKRGNRCSIHIISGCLMMRFEDVE